MNNWPPIMHVPSKDLKRCLGGEDMHTKTMWDRLSKLGYPKEKGMFIVTDELVDRVAELQKQQIVPNFEKYEPQSEGAKKLTEG